MCRKILLYIFCIVTATVASCTNESVRPTPCENGAFRCNAGNIEICSDGNWNISENCEASNKICASQADGQLVCTDTEAKSCVAKCVDGVLTKCNEDGSSNILKCSDTNKICGTDNAGKPACVEDNSPIYCMVEDTKLFPGNTICDEDGNVVTCNDDGTTSSEPCTRGICASGNCVPRNCGDILDGKTICQNNQLMICSDGTLIEAENACSGETPACRDGENACSAYKNCGNIQHGTTGCFDNNIVSCNDGSMTLETDCVLENKYCASDEENEGQFICKLPTVTDCQFKGQLFKKGETVCDGNVLRTCSKEVNEEFDDGIECKAIAADTPICDIYTNECRAEKKCGKDGSIESGAIICSPAGSNKAICNDGILTALTGEDACKGIAHGFAICIETDSGPTCSFECEPGYRKDNDTCVSMCDLNKEYFDKFGHCSCDESKLFIGVAGSCQCEDGYVENDEHKCINALVGTECTPDNWPICDGDDILECDPDSFVWKHIYCPSFGDSYTCQNNNNKNTICHKDNHDYIIKSQKCDQSFEGYCAGNMRVYCENGIIKGESCSPECAVRLSSGKKFAECITPEITDCPVEGWGISCYSYPVQTADRYDCGIFSDGNYHRYNVGYVLCSNICEKGCKIDECDTENEYRCLDDTTMVTCEINGADNRKYWLARKCEKKCLLNTPYEEARHYCVFGE